MERPVAVFDIDGSVYRENLLEKLFYSLVRQGSFPSEVLHDVVSLQKNWRATRDRKTYLNYIDSLVSLYVRHVQGLQVQEVTKAVDSVLSNMDESLYVFSRELIKKVKDTHFLLAISGSPQEIVGPFTQVLGFHSHHASVFETENGLYTGRAWAGTRHKDKTLLAARQKHNLVLAGSIGLGDTDSDIPMLKLVERPIAFNPNKELMEHALLHNWEIILEHKDTIVHLQGRGKFELENGFGHLHINDSV